MSKFIIAARFRLPLCVAVACVAPLTSALAQDAPAAAPTTVVPEASPTAAPAASDSAPKAKHRLQWGVETSVFFPTDSKVRNRFGGTRFGIGPALGSLRQSDRGGRIAYDLKVNYAERGDNYAIWVPVGVEYRRAWSDNVDSQAYYGATVNAVPNLIRADPEGVKSRLRLTAGGSVFTGVMFGANRYLEARYSLVAAEQGFNLSGFSIGGGIRF